MDKEIDNDVESKRYKSDNESNYDIKNYCSLMLMITKAHDDAQILKPRANIVQSMSTLFNLYSSTTTRQTN